MPERRPLPFDPIAEARRQWEVHGWPDAAPAMAVVTSIMRAQQIFLARADAVLRPLGLTFARYEVLMLLSFSRRGDLALGKIGERLQVNPASVTNAIDRLEEQGLVARVPNPADGRGTLGRLTPAGRQLAAEATAVMNEEVFASLGLADGELASLFGLLQGLRRAAGDYEDPAPGTHETDAVADDGSHREAGRSPAVPEPRGVSDGGGGDR